MGMKSPAKKKEIVKRSRPTDAELGKIDSNNGDAGKIISDLTAGHKSIEYESRDIALYDIRVNADNEIFRQADTQEDIVQLAEDIQRHSRIVSAKRLCGIVIISAIAGRFAAVGCCTFSRCGQGIKCRTGKEHCNCEHCCKQLLHCFHTLPPCLLLQGVSFVR